jgi:predicted choloylglycine hydrolase
MAVKKKYKILLYLLLILAIILALFIWAIYIPAPEVEETDVEEKALLRISDTHFQIGNNWLRKNKYGIWEMYVEGTPYERGVLMGHLGSELMDFQEQSFVENVYSNFKSSTKLFFLKYFVAWQNRNLDKYIPEEYQQEIYGVSRFASDQYDFIGPKFQRKLMYHAAHDIGHTVQNMGLVGCSAFSAWGEHSADSKIITGRNFDFYIGEAFRKNRVLLFSKPYAGHAFVSYSWIGMVGVLSGMNEKGLSVSINAGPPELPMEAKTPVSILAREILQHAANIEEAIQIANNRDIFVSQNILISSKYDKRSIVIEKTPDKMNILESEDGLLLCTNHFQTEDLASLEENINFKLVSSTGRRIERLNTLTDTNRIDVKKAVEILRDRNNLSETSLGYGNEENINILMAHHSIIFQPETDDVWISVGLSPEEQFVKYNLLHIFSNSVRLKSTPLYSDEIIPSSSWAKSKAFTNYIAYQKLYRSLKTKIDQNKVVREKELLQLIELNPELYKPYLLAGDFYADEGVCDKSVPYLNEALKRHIPWQKEIDEIKEKLENCKLK